MPHKGRVATNLELQERVEALESGRKLKIADLPLDALKRELRKEPQNPTELLLPRSINQGLLAVGSSALVARETRWTGRTPSNVSAEMMPWSLVTIPEDGNYWFISTGDFISGAEAAIIRIAKSTSNLIGPQHVVNPNLRLSLALSSYMFQSCKAGETVGVYFAQTGAASCQFVDGYLAAIRVS